jgi:hypothetical protein
MRRRDVVTGIAAFPAAAQTTSPVTREGRLKQCVTRGVFGRQISFEDTCREAGRLAFLAANEQKE